MTPRTSTSRVENVAMAQWENEGGSVPTQSGRRVTSTASQPATALTINGATLTKLAMLGNHLPRQCGIATFTTDLADAITAEFPTLDCAVVAMNDAGHRHDYPTRVRCEIAEGELAAYEQAADFVNANAFEVVSVQHEYGIFWGAAGGHLFALLRELRAPIVTTLHTILAEPNVRRPR